METFEQPANGHRESFGNIVILWALLFGWFYFIVRGLWTHVLLQVVIVMGFAALTGGPGALIALPMWLGYAVAAPALVRAKYLRDGWREIR